jgi:predicted glycogen debranching enzyme
MTVKFGREACGYQETAEIREWLTTNGIGGYASATVSGMLTRRYHGLLVAALKPPLGRTLMLSKLDETLTYDGSEYELFANRWSDGTVSPRGFLNLERFNLDGTIPVWRFACANAVMEKRIWMKQGANTTYIRYTLSRATSPVTLSIKALVNYRDYHGTTRADDWNMNIEKVAQGIRIVAYPEATPFYILSDRANAQSTHDWYYGFNLSQGQYRGLDHTEDHLHAATFRATLNPCESLTFVASTDENADSNGERALGSRMSYEMELREKLRSTIPGKARQIPSWIFQLALASDQFIADRPLQDDPDGKTIIAGYHWFGDWGRDTMISLPGLTISTGRPDVCRSILRTFAKYVDRGMLPNRFPDSGEQPEYNTVDATLWYFEAIKAYHEATGDDDFISELFPVLTQIIDWHTRGTRYNIHVDPEDGLLFSGEKGVQLTWMDAKIGDWVVTPRIGKPIEINALWYNALLTMAKFAKRVKKSSKEYESAARKASQGFSRFWDDNLGYCYDVLDGPGGNDTSLRPNQIFAVSLPESPLTTPQQKAVVDICALRLLTSHGLRSLDNKDPHYQGHYGGDQFHRDSAYHQGTVWGWLLGPFALAHLKVYNDPMRAREYIEPMCSQLFTHGLGTLSEIFDGDAPFTPRGCIAQAWTVAEVLRAWLATEGSAQKKL